MKVPLFKFMIAFFLVIKSAFTMLDDKELLKLTSIEWTQQKTYEKGISSSSIITIEAFPDELIFAVFRFVEIPDLGNVTQVSTRWKKVTETPGLWRSMGLKYYGDYLSKEDLRENPKQTVISHYLSVLVNLSGNLKKIRRLVSDYKLNSYTPLFKRYIDLNFQASPEKDLAVIHDFIAQGVQEITARSAKGFEPSKMPVVSSSSTGNSQATQREVEGLAEGKYGYKKDPISARKFIESLVEKGDPEAIMRKIRGLLQGQYGYEKDSATAKMLLNRFLVMEENVVALERQVEALEWGEPDIARELNESLVERGNPVAIERKLVALSAGGYYSLPFAGYCYLTSGVKVPTYGYENNPLAAREINESLIEKGDLDAIKRKIKSLLGGTKHMYNSIDRSLEVNITYGYKQDLVAAREFIESLIICEFPIARGIGKYIKASAMKYGNSQLDYTKDHNKSLEFIKQYHVPY